MQQKKPTVAQRGSYNHGLHLGNITRVVLGYHGAAYDREERERLGVYSCQARDLEMDS